MHDSHVATPCTERTLLPGDLPAILSIAWHPDGDGAGGIGAGVGDGGGIGEGTGLGCGDGAGVGSGEHWSRCVQALPLEKRTSFAKGHGMLACKLSAMPKVPLAKPSPQLLNILRKANFPLPPAMIQYA